MLALAFLSLALGAPATPAAAENPMYICWHDLPIGTAVTTRTATTIAGKLQPGGDVKTMRLVARTPKKVVVEETLTSFLNGEKIAGDPERIDYPRALAAGLGKRPAPDGKTSGEEEVEVLGKTYMTRWSETKSQTEAGPATTRTWFSDAMPGQIVRSVTTVPAVKKEVTIEVIELKIPGEPGAR
jgi:hypothetical protein